MNGDSAIFLPAVTGVILVVLAGSVLSLLKTALSCVRKPRLHSLIEGGGKKYVPVLAASEKPGRYLMSLRIAAVFFEILSGCIGGFAFSTPLGNVFLSSGLSLAAAETLAVFVVCCGIMVFFFLTGEVILRQIALAFPEEISAAFFPLVRIIPVFVFPLLIVSRALSSLMKRILSAEAARSGMTESDLHHALLEGEKSGVVESEERSMVEGVFYLGDRPVSAFMTHRSEIQWLDINAGPEEARQVAETADGQNHFPVSDGDLDEVSGAVLVQDIFKALTLDAWPGLKSVMRQPYYVPETMPALKAFEAFKKADAFYLFVMDEYGGFSGILTMRNLIEEIVGGLSASSNSEETIVKQPDGTWLADGGVNIDDAAGELELTRLGSEYPEYHTLAGFILDLAGEIPREGASFDHKGYRFKILDMDNNRIDKIGISKIEDSGESD
jgi:putative hemolysin